jgi:hypothetical protein
VLRFAPPRALRLGSHLLSSRNGNGFGMSYLVILNLRARFVSTAPRSDQIDPRSAFRRPTSAKPPMSPNARDVVAPLAAKPRRRLLGRKPRRRRHEAHPFSPSSTIAQRPMLKMCLLFQIFAVNDLASGARSRWRRLLRRNSPPCDAARHCQPPDTCSPLCSPLIVQANAGARLDSPSSCTSWPSRSRSRNRSDA